MYRRDGFDKVYIISEIHPQFSGDIAIAQTMMQQTKLAGGDAVKVQLYDSRALLGNDDRIYVELTKQELKDMKQYAENLGLDFFASVFNMDRVEWCEELGIESYKIASPTVSNKELCQAMIDTGKPVYISLGMYDWQEKGFPYEGDNLTYFYCVSKYPTNLDEVEMPLFGTDHFEGYSDHTIGIAACIYAMARGATYLEKHFTLNKSTYFPTEMGHSGSMDMDDLRNLRQMADSLSILKIKAEN